MARRNIKPRSKKSAYRRKSIGYYLRIFFVSIIVSVAIIAGGNYFFELQSPCANSGTCKSDLSLNIDNNAIGIFEGRKVVPPKIDLALDISKRLVLGASVPSGEKHIYVDLSTQKLYAYEGNTQIFETLISSGRWGWTPVGNFNIWQKLRSTRMAGGEGDSAYNLPNVPWVMYFYHDFGLHGAYWHNNFGHTMSHGCVNLRQVDAEILFNWADGPTFGKKGTAVSVCDKFISPDTCVQNKPVN